MSLSQQVEANVVEDFEPLPPSSAYKTSSPRALLLSFALLCLVGVAVSTELTRIHVLTHTDPSYRSVCAVSEGVNCETVAISPYSAFAGVPVSVWGIFAYALMFALALSARAKKRFHATWGLGALFALSLIASLVSLLLAFISLTRIDSICLFCAFSYLINLTLFTLALVAWRRTKRHLFELVNDDFTALTTRPRHSAAMALLGGATLCATLVYYPSYWKTPGWNDLPNLTTGIDERGHHWVGAKAPKITIVEFSDYECPHCRAAHHAVRAFTVAHPNKVRLVHRHLPLDAGCHPALKRPFHQHACYFAEAAECAGVQGHFWAMNDALFSGQSTVKAPESEVMKLAVRLGLDRDAFKRCLRTRATRQRVAEDIRDAMKRRLAGTPCYFVGDKRYIGRIPLGELERLLTSTSS